MSRDGKITIGLEDVKITLDGNLVGGAKSLEVTFKQENKTIYEGGSMMPREIKRSLASVTGTLEQLFLDVDIANTLFDFEDGYSPEFVLVGKTKRQVKPSRIVTINGAVFNSIALANLINGSDGATTSCPFDALSVRFRE